MRHAAALALLVATGAACGSAGPDGGVVPEGEFAGEHVFLRVGATGAVVGFDCAHGEITAPLRLDEDGRFGLPGYYVIDVGPVSIDGENRLPATYRGRYDGRILTLSFEIDGFETGPFAAAPGPPPQLRQCR